MKKISFIGGDLITIYLMKNLKKDNFEIMTYALEEADQMMGLEGVQFTENLDEVIRFSNIIVMPMPLSDQKGNIMGTFSEKKISFKNIIPKIKNKTLIAGRIPISYYKDLKENHIKFFDVSKSNELRILSAISISEGVLKIAIDETQKTIHSSKVLVLGFGRIGKMISKVFDAVGAKVTAEARKYGDLAWITANGYDALHLNDLNDHLGEFDIIINTIPHLILDSKRLKNVEKNTLLIDIATDPYGIDRKAARELDLKVVWALSIPEKIAPTTYANVIKKSIYVILEESDLNI